MATEINFKTLSDSGDTRGQSVSLTSSELEALEKIQDVHIAAIRPGAVRGNHFHQFRGELITVVYNGKFSVHWDTGEGTMRRSRTFSGGGGVSFSPPLGWAHAVRNDGSSDIWIFVASDQPYDRSNSDNAARDAIPRVVTD